MLLATSMLMVMPSDKITHLLEHEKSDAPPTPPPMHHVPHHTNPYDFITNPAPVPKKKLLPGGDSKIKRIILVGAGAIVLIMLILTLVSFISGGGSLKEDYTKLTQQQAELIRIADIGASKAKGPDAKYLASTTKLSLLSTQPTILQIAKKAGAKTDAKTLLLGKDTKTDTLLTEAAQANKFDEVFTITIREGLKTYQQTLKKIHDQTSIAANKSELAKAYLDASNLIGKEESSSSTPGSTSTQ